MESKKKKFSIDDFEKGLMLAGFITPQNSIDLEELDALDQYEKELSKKRQEVYFKRAVLAGEIVNVLKNEPTFGRVKFQKLVYLSEHVCEMNLQERYEKFAAGPFDNKFMHSINQEFKKQKWFSITFKKNNGYNIPEYHVSKNFEKHQGYYQSYFGRQDITIKKMIELFRKMRTRDVELVATVYYCLLEIKETGQLLNKNTLINNFYKFSESKSQFLESEIINSVKWMKRNGIYPLS